MSTLLLVTRWFELFPKGDDEAVFHSFCELRECYRQRGRSYHTFDHVEFMLVARRRYFPDADDAVDKAIFGHDLVYDARRKDNEERSAAGMRVIQHSLGDSETSVAEVVRLIPLTQQHSPAAHDTAGQQLCDLDLLSLGLPPEEYQANTALIRAEYAHASEAEWAAGREEFISRFLSRRFIYATGQIREEFEAVARRNLEHERSLLV